MQALKGHPQVYAIACDTDGIDGTEDNAGVFLTPQTYPEAQSKGLSPAPYLDNNDAYSFFKQVNALVYSGPTFTNVNDFRAILVTPPKEDQ